MDEFRYPLFFEAQEDLTDREREKIKMHFLKRRLSGGGECEIEKIGENAYRVCFMVKEDQERVLQRKFHTISLPRGELCLTVTRDSPSHKPDLQFTSHQQTKQSKKELEKVYTLDPYLLRYLEDSPKAAKVLHKQLSAIDCSVRINVEEEEAVVKGDVEKEPSGASGGASGIAAERWEMQVDRVFIGLIETYLAHHVVDSAPAKALQRDLSFVTDNLRVYRDAGYPVVVGEVGEVSARIAILEQSVPTRKQCPVPKKQYSLVEEEFCREMNARFPNVKIHRDEPNVVFLEGLEEDVQSGSRRLDELIKDVKEKRVPLPKPLLNFMTSSDALSRYQLRFQQGLRNPVTLEMDTDLILSSLSPGALEEAAAAVQRDLRHEILELDSPMAVAPCLERLKEALTKAKNQANHADLRVEVSYHSQTGGTSKTKVQLVGYSADVGKLKDVLLDYKLNQVETEEQLSLPIPEMVDCFDKIRSLIDINHPKVKLTPSHSPSPCVLISGPRSLVQETREALKSGLARLTSDRLVLNGSVAQLYFQGEGKRSMELVESNYHVIITEQQDGSSTQNTLTMPGLTTKGRSNTSLSWSNISMPTSMLTSMPTRMPTSMPTSIPTSSTGTTMSSGLINNIVLEIKLGNLEKQQVDVLVAPMIKQELTRTMVGKCLVSEAGGTSMKANFDLAVRNRHLAPGDVLQVDGPQSLGCSKIFFIECLPWDGARGQSVQALRSGLAKALELCAQQGWRSVAMSVIGLGLILKYPKREAVEALTEEIARFGRGGSTGSLSTVSIVIKPGSPDAEECFHDVSQDLSTIMNWGGQAIFQSLTSDLDVITLTLGGRVSLQLVFGDITNETTDAVVNTTDFVDFETPGVCKDILTMAGPEVEAHLKSAARVNRGDIFVSKPGQFPCKAILHVCGEKDVGVIEGLVRDIIKRCEEKGYKSVAIPAICAGIGGLDRGTVAKAILRGVSTAVSSTTPHCPSLIRLVLNKIDVFEAFKGAAGTTFPSAFSAAVNTTVEPSVQLPPTQQHQAPPPSRANLDLNVLLATSGTAAPASVFLVVGRSSNDVSQAITELNRQYQVQCGSHSFTSDDLAVAGFMQDQVEDLRRLVDALNLQMDCSQASGGGQAGQFTWTVTGLKDDVNQVSQLINSYHKDKLTRELRVREEDELYGRVAWCILGARGDWERLPKAANHKLETGDVRGGVLDGQGVQWSIDTGRMEATAQGTRRVAKLKQLQNQTDFSLPLYWDNMGAAEQLKRVELQHSSAEFQRVKESFKRTAAKTVLKIERLQNVHLRRGYEVQKKRLSDKNQQGTTGVREKLLYHGTTHDNSKSIMDTGFNRAFAGQNATAYGFGTYFAVDASYSANPTYSKPGLGSDRSQLMLVVRVLTGAYTQGQSGLKVAPDSFDSVVDNVQNPTMFVVFYDNQAYPDYLITFK